MRLLKRADVEGRVADVLGRAAIAIPGAIIALEAAYLGAPVDDAFGVAEEIGVAAIAVARAEVTSGATLLSALMSRPVARLTRIAAVVVVVAGSTGDAAELAQMGVIAAAVPLLPAAIEVERAGEPVDATTLAKAVDRVAVILPMVRARLELAAVVVILARFARIAAQGGLALVSALVAR